jgi:hypothetical protein
VSATVKGGLELRKALRNYAPELAKETQKEIAEVLKPIVRDARAFIPATSPLSNWARQGGRFPTFDPGAMKRGIGYKTTPSRANSRGFTALAQLRNRSGAGSIYEIAGRLPAGSDKSSRPNFAQALGPMQGKGREQGRALYAAWERDYGKATVAVLAAIKNAGDKFNATVGKR